MKKALEVTVFAVAMILASWCAGQLFLEAAPFRGMKIYTLSPMDAFRPVIYCFWSSVGYAVFALILVKKEEFRKRATFYVLSCGIPFGSVVLLSLGFLTFRPDSDLGVDFHRLPVFLIPAFFLAVAWLAFLTYSRKKRPIKITTDNDGAAPRRV
jgi:hypothetical protein